MHRKVHAEFGGRLPRKRPAAGTSPGSPPYDAIPGVLHQLCTQHILRDLEDAAQSYPDAIWPGQAAGALRALIHAANTARDKGLAAVPDDTIAADLVLFRNAVRVGLSEVRRVPGAKSKQKPGRTLLECLRDREADVLRFLSDLRIPPTSDLASLCTSWVRSGVSGFSRWSGDVADVIVARGTDISRWLQRAAQARVVAAS